MALIWPMMAIAISAVKPLDLAGLGRRDRAPHLETGAELRLRLLCSCFELALARDLTKRIKLFKRSADPLCPTTANGRSQGGVRHD